MSAPTLILPAHNRRAVTLACLQKLQDNGDLTRFAVSVVDDGSSDGTAEAVREKFPAVTVLAGDGQLWWTGAMRLGMDHAFGAGAPGVIWLNDDCLPEATALETLAALMQDSGSALVGPACFTPEGIAVPTGFVGRKIIPSPATGRVAVEGLSGYCVAIPRLAWEKIGPPDARRFPHYYGDSAYTLAAHRAGLKLFLTGDARVKLPGYKAPPASPAAYRAPTLNWRQNWHHVFVAKKSPFRLVTQWHFLRLKYGNFKGTAFAVARTIRWAIQFTFG